MTDSAADAVLRAERVEVDLDVVGFTEFAAEQGWGDGLPLVPPTQERVLAMLAGSTRRSDDVVAVLPPANGVCTVEALAVNAVMAGAPSDAMPLLCAALEAMVEPTFDLAGLNATTGSVVPAVFVNGPVRDRLGVPYRAGCFGGVAGPAPAIGRALRLVMRNVAGHVVGTTSQSVFGQPGRVTGVVVGEWEDRSPWAPLAVRRGVRGDAVTVFGAMGTANICDTVATTGTELLEIIGKSVASMGTNGYLVACPDSEFLVCINPMWAEIIGRDVPAIDDVQELLHRHASLPLEWWPPAHQRALTDAGRVATDGRVHLAQRPASVLVMVCGGLGNLHSAAIHSWGNTQAVTRGF